MSKESQQVSPDVINFRERAKVIKKKRKKLAAADITKDEYKQRTKAIYITSTGIGTEVGSIIGPAVIASEINWSISGIGLLIGASILGVGGYEYRKFREQRKTRIMKTKEKSFPSQVTDITIFQNKKI